MQAAMTSSFLGSRTCLPQTARPARASCSRMVVRAAADSPVWLPGTEKPKQLEGLVGNFGFDPLQLGTDKERLEWYAEAEKTNGRWAMAAVAGILGQEILGRGVWFNVGAEPQWLPDSALLAIEFFVVGHFEVKRFQGWNKHKTSGVLDSYPFDPLGQSSPAMELREIKNGRLAMVAFVGFAVQALVTREQPIEGLQNHLADPFGHNIITNVGNLPAFVGKA
jgi:light-harvesting complex I chlorophyll a/b binding protein 5